MQSDMDDVSHLSTYDSDDDSSVHDSNPIDEDNHDEDNHDEDNHDEDNHDIFHEFVVDILDDTVDDDLKYTNDMRSCKYVKQIIDSSGLHVNHPKKVIKKFQDNGIMGIFFLFLSKTFLINNVMVWTIQAMKEIPSCAGFIVHESLFLAYIGLEIGMSIIKFMTIGH